MLLLPSFIEGTDRGPWQPSVALPVHVSVLSGLLFAVASGTQEVGALIDASPGPKAVLFHSSLWHLQSFLQQPWGFL